MSDPHEPGPQLPDPPSWYDPPPDDSGLPRSRPAPPANPFRGPGVQSPPAGAGRSVEPGVLIAVVSLLAFAAIAVVLLSGRGSEARDGSPTPAEELVDYQEAPAPASAPAAAAAAADEDGGWDEPPELVNGDEVARAMERSYPPLLREAGVTGSTEVRFRILADGSVDEGSVVVQATTNDDFGRAATRVVPRMRFRPGRRNGSAAPGWVTIPLQWRVAP